MSFSTQNSSVDVLIVGAGPTGLAAAAFLNNLGVKVRIIDKNQARSSHSKALGTHAGTLECFDYAFGPSFSQKMIEKGVRVQQSSIDFSNTDPVQIDLSLIPSRHNFVLILPQSETEKILEEFLESSSLKVERNKEFFELQDHGSFVVSKVKLENGESEEIRSSFVIGADGAHSLVRRLLQISFKGGEYTGNFILADLKVDWPFPFGSMRIFFSEKGVVAAFPLREENDYRFVLISNQIDLSSGQSEISPKEFLAFLKELSPNSISILEFLWLSRFRVHHRMVQKFQKGNIFLAGDAAHIHSPVGGQGMNTGIQDSFNLAYKLQKVLRKDYPISLLESYNKERFSVAQKVLRGTDFVSQFGLLSQLFFLKWIRKRIVPHLIKIKFIQKKIVYLMSGVGVARKEIARVSK